MTDVEAFELIGNLIDMSFDASFNRGAKRALFLLDELSKRDLKDEDEIIVEYY
ncbi:hypothetical protein [Bartonella sp. HY038]|uniref:hypothetical protein n=1 Tax=Bartonella sp. HY038 TaxID=2759660 RepID=UPI0015F88F00|nr:hypothetical protein [Bartonella sp. HY038]